MGSGGGWEILAAAAHLRNGTSALVLSSHRKIVSGRLSANHREAKILVFSPFQHPSKTDFSPFSTAGTTNNPTLVDKRS